jgi:hypothetical protein
LSVKGKSHSKETIEELAKFSPTEREEEEEEQFLIWEILTLTR